MTLLPVPVSRAMRCSAEQWSRQRIDVDMDVNNAKAPQPSEPIQAVGLCLLIAIVLSAIPNLSSICVDGSSR